MGNPPVRAALTPAHGKSEKRHQSLVPRNIVYTFFPSPSPWCSSVIAGKWISFCKGWDWHRAKDVLVVAEKDVVAHSLNESQDYSSQPGLFHYSKKQKTFADWESIAWKCYKNVCYTACEWYVVVISLAALIYRWVLCRLCFCHL
jgi:hypothetical protein